MNTLQAHGTTIHVLTKNTTGQYQPHGSLNHMPTGGQDTNVKGVQKRYWTDYSVAPSYVNFH